ncbi:biosynthetic arginine decarboxylase [Tuwongella immobilis]|uniref:Biosynthetic arginine decarboxylase n=1 Tax=Tuwongella immobilis TaxID=692036 RepID=A0A6C2YHQ3_9BACT|nr:biosynthetic arginine decarboxylase [Tuwongella immobilis]VIP01058.1 arginine decarboxylase : Biosynthetic arginine decarboxylase OS=Solibacter usitatus (strain Ellin6076) GN=speA PE=3 SV=1: Orn_Arg_deC_N: Orn_DAP_Arg_deC [Tuwongella immobilis]VTR97541.1 arginine decarboxylase : Biosynthetic arginine decarboxylase OS=Solibacter usitatus (strain Ellin6076) GN=speA PE=3 SV=1: Orn_Arg_deC_N: Orn_DAP_Arg_deC [Tuwongella immobilis]
MTKSAERRGTPSANGLSQPWKVQESVDLYGIKNWGKGYFGVNKAGHVVVYPTKDSSQVIDLKDLVDQLQKRDIQLPILLRFTDILRHRIGEIADAFHTAIKDAKYNGEYCCVYPIKVNQQRHVVEEIIDFGKPFKFGLEAGSKPELLAVLAMTSSSTPIICNGFKDEEFIKMVVLARKLGKQIIPVVEKATELEMIVKYAEELGVRPMIGVRVKLATRGAGRWRSSAGYRSKFGLTLTEVLEAVEYLKKHDMADCLKLVHFHMGSQITNIRKVKDALTEAARIYVELARVGGGVEFLDVGGGLGIDYDGSQTDFESSINYTLQEYANDVVYRIKAVCDDAGVPHPTIISESGRAVVAYHSMLIFDVLGTSNFDRCEAPETIPKDAPQPLSDLFSIYRDLNKKNYTESYHDAAQAMEEALNLFNLGYLSLEMRAQAERLYWAVGKKLQRLVSEMDFVPEELQGLDTLLSDTYFCNFSVFQSMPDSWAIKQLFPIMPIHRLNERPTRRAVLGDITCDSDGKVDQFIDLRDVRSTLELHEHTGEPYYLGAFLLGAYQEILGDLHNLFGDTNAVHVSVDEDGKFSLDEVIKGDTVREVLHYVQYSGDELSTRMRKEVEKAVRGNKLSVTESRQFLRFYESGLDGYTYLEE